MASIWSQQIHKMTDDLQTALDKITNVNDEDGYAWRDSSGAMQEVMFARAYDIPVLFTEQEVVDFICKETQYGQS